MTPTTQILVTVTVDGVRGEATIDRCHYEHACSRWDFDERTDKCPRCEANNRAEEDARAKIQALNMKGNP